HNGVHAFAFMVGGFATSDYVFNKVYTALAPVSDGAISSYLDHIVMTRISKITYGNFCHIPYKPNAQDHCERTSKIFISVSGHKCTSDFFDVILPKVCHISYFDYDEAYKCLYYLSEHSDLGDEGV
ncbi:hypothetical protein BDN70DRAFT_982202, partial [Pholiota conissans]